MGRPNTPEGRRRTASFTVLFTQEERERFKNDAAMMDISPSHFVRRAVVHYCGLVESRIVKEPDEKGA